MLVFVVLVGVDLILWPANGGSPINLTENWDLEPNAPRWSPDSRYVYFVSGIDYVIKNYPVDPRRVAATGHSYGGFMTNWLITMYP